MANSTLIDLPAATAPLSGTEVVYGVQSGSDAKITTQSIADLAASGNAATATALQTARTINGVSFNGTANITVTAAANTLTGTALASGVVSSSLTSFGSGIALGTPASGVLTNCTGTATGLTSGITNALKSATTTINVSSATAPTAGQVLTATSGTAATWQTPTGGGGGSSAFNDITSGTNTTAAMVVGSGSTLSATGTGSIVATTVANNTVRPVPQMLATRCGVSGSAIYVSTAQPGVASRIQHCLPYGAKSLYPIYAAFNCTYGPTGYVQDLKNAGGYGFYATSVAVVNGGTGYAIGDSISVTGVAANQFPPMIQVDAVSGGVVTAASVLTGGGFGAVPAPGLNTTKITGSGTGLTVTLGVQACAMVARAGIEQVWGTQTAMTDTNLTGVREVFSSANANLGEQDIILPFGTPVVPESVMVGLDPGALIGTRFYTPGTGFTGGRRLSGSAGLNEIVQSSTNLASATPSGGTFPTAAGPFVYDGFQPIAIMGIPQTPGPTFAIIGDSIGYGTTSIVGGSTTRDTMDANGNSGFCERAIDQVCPWTNLSVGSDRVSNYLNQDFTSIRWQLLKMLNVSHILDQIGINDIHHTIIPYAQFRDSKIKYWQMLYGLGIKEIWACTLVPKSSSTDGFVTVVNQTPSTANPNIQAYNADLRAGNFAAYGVTRVIDLGTSVESTVGSGVWPANGTYDGIHPSQAQQSIIAAAIAYHFPLATL